MPEIHFLIDYGTTRKHWNSNFSDYLCCISCKIDAVSDQNISINSKNCFFDRGIPDILAYLDYKKILFNNKFKVSAEKYKYDKVFITEPWKKIYRKDQQRYESYEELLEIDKKIKETYKNLRYKYFIIPNTNVVERVNYIIDKIGWVRKVQI